MRKCARGMAPTMWHSFYPDVIVSKIDFSGANFKSDYLENKALHYPPHPPYFKWNSMSALSPTRWGTKKRGFPFFGKVTIYCERYILSSMSY